jgi:hypothetical protein
MLRVKTIWSCKKWESYWCRKVDILYRLERKIIEILLLYGNKNEEFEDVFWEQTPKVKSKLLLKKREYKVYQRIYLVCKKMR